MIGLNVPSGPLFKVRRASGRCLQEGFQANGHVFRCTVVEQSTTTCVAYPGLRRVPRTTTVSTARSWWNGGLLRPGLTEVEYRGTSWQRLLALSGLAPEFNNSWCEHVVQQSTSRPILVFGTSTCTPGSNRDITWPSATSVLAC
jgi:hypothetical protein